MKGRSRIGRDIRDGISQSLYMLNLGLEACADRAQQGQESLLSPIVTRGVLQRLVDLASKDLPSIVDPLSNREQEVLTFVAQRHTNREIAARLMISNNTVRNHVRHIMDKLDMTRRSQAAIYPARHGILDPNPSPSSWWDPARPDSAGPGRDSQP